VISQAAADDILASQAQLEHLSLACTPSNSGGAVWSPRPAAAASLQSLSLACGGYGAVDISGLVAGAPDAAPGSIAWRSLQRLSIKGQLSNSNSLAQLSSSITSLALPSSTLAAGDLQHLQRLPRLAELELSSVDQQAWAALGQLAQLQKLQAHKVAPDVSVQLPALEHLTCCSLELAPGAQPGSLVAALPALQAEVILCPAILRALQGHQLLDSVAMCPSLLEPAAAAWPTGGLSSLPALREFVIASPPAAWLGPLLEDLAGCRAVEVARVVCSQQQGAGGPEVLPAGALQAMAARVAAGDMARLARLEVVWPDCAQKWALDDALPLVEALAKRGGGAGGPACVELALPVGKGGMQGAELRQLLQARGLLPRADLKELLVVQCEQFAGSTTVILHFV
jgi:hypothetical protein